MIVSFLCACGAPTQSVSTAPHAEPVDAAVAPNVHEVVATPPSHDLPAEIVGAWVTDTTTVADRYKRKLMDKDMMLLMLRHRVSVTIAREGKLTLEAEGQKVETSCAAPTVEGHTYVLECVDGAQHGRLKLDVTETAHMEYRKELLRDGGSTWDDPWFYVRK